MKLNDGVHKAEVAKSFSDWYECAIKEYVGRLDLDECTPENSRKVVQRVALFALGALTRDLERNGVTKADVIEFLKSHGLD
jgi:hypothetical protein